jgi:hypothetical protein
VTVSGRAAQRNRLDAVVVTLGTLALLLLMALWTAMVPVLYVPNPEAWSLAVPGCQPAGSVVPHVEYTFPLWAKVWVSWTASTPIVLFGYGPHFQLNQQGESGSTNFVSDATPIVLQPSVISTNQSCQSVLVQIHAGFMP